ncbi:TetR/AcrR family transcriptional regulator [Robiginitalea sp. SC105]|uniref:TetR/AcrR family transcriptional regulator n=1 Tax=Robiginitalea sp. SC105 TaxID=2762332 RepID=UPI001639CDA3|nr:TetR/AcrR family transcriptional regulator [Robiginitalea sp. SC105]MBC2837930.1 TetR/AcrR family transcriptional regulator [Robiginitalea sp. SC105]
MDALIRNMEVSINPRLYLKDPQSTQLGKRIVSNGIDMISAMGVEQFNFKKLGEQIGSNESSIYRYFENKHKFLIYLCSWYWGWLELRLVQETHRITEPLECLKRGIDTLTRPVEADASYGHIDEVALHEIVVNEYSKPFLTREVDQQNREGYFEIYKRLVHRLADMIRAVNPEYPFAASLSSTVLEGSLHHFFLEQHFPSLTELEGVKNHTLFFRQLVLSAINK